MLFKIGWEMKISKISNLLYREGYMNAISLAVEKSWNTVSFAMGTDIDFIIVTFIMNKLVGNQYDQCLYMEKDNEDFINLYKAGEHFISKELQQLFDKKRATLELIFPYFTSGFFQCIELHGIMALPIKVDDGIKVLFFETDYDFKEIKIMPKGLRWEFRCDIFGEELFHKFRSEFSEAILSYLKIL